MNSRSSGPQHVAMEFKTDGTTLTGTITTPQGESEITDGQIDGEYILFNIVRTVNGHEVKQHYRGHVNGEVINFTLQTFEAGGAERNQNFNVKKIGG